MNEVDAEEAEDISDNENESEVELLEEQYSGEESKVEFEGQDSDLHQFET